MSPYCFSTPQWVKPGAFILALSIGPTRKFRIMTGRNVSRWDRNVSNSLQWRHMGLMPSQITGNFHCLFNRLLTYTLFWSEALRRMQVCDQWKTMRHAPDLFNALESVLTTLNRSWWRHQMETFFALLVLCAGNSPVSGEFPPQRTVTRSFDVFFELRSNRRLGKQSWGWWFETPPCSLWRHCNALESVLTTLNRWPSFSKQHFQRFFLWKCTNFD